LGRFIIAYRNARHTGSRICTGNKCNIETLCYIFFSAKFPALHEMMKKVMSSEMEIVVKEEKYVALCCNSAVQLGLFQTLQQVAALYCWSFWKSTIL